MPKLFVRLLVLALLLPCGTRADTAPALPACGSLDPIRLFGIGREAPRRCAAGGERHYAPRHGGLGYALLDIESAACFVPDASYALLDEIVDEAAAAVRPLLAASDGEITRAFALQASRTIGDLLAAKGFRLHTPTVTLGDALAARSAPGTPARHWMDCDTSGFIYLTIAENLQLPLALVEITTANGEHDYLRWTLADGGRLEWDSNGRAACVTPAGLPPFEGRTMTRDNVLGEVYALRAHLYRQRGETAAAAQDLLRAVALYPESPRASNNFAWLVATQPFAGRERYFAAAVAEATRAAGLQRSATHLDTLACAQAAQGDFAAAVATEGEAVALDDRKVYRERLARLRERRDCTGARD
ncbi:tetratricopeptide repeat protein [Solimonas soli]|uniref:tetratricopeptide repeat protein n=1 Tax=Solimonas soli TaxID=413479 RepID=UPI0004814249|nr:hypothetical protein [Solimonas soli]